MNYTCNTYGCGKVIVLPSAPTHARDEYVKHAKLVLNKLYGK